MELLETALLLQVGLFDAVADSEPLGVTLQLLVRVGGWLSLFEMA